MFNYIWTNKDEDFIVWDHFLSSTKRGHYLQLSHWLNSYHAYGFYSELLIVKDPDNQIVAGLGIVISKFRFIKFTTCGCGPIIKEGYDHLFLEIVNRFKERAISNGSICSMINFPILENADSFLLPYCLDINLQSFPFSDAKSGNPIKAVTAINGFRVVNLTNIDSLSPLESVLKRCNENTRRNIKKSLKNNLQLGFATTSAEVKEAYQLIELNAQTQGYSVRSWDDFKESLMRMISDGTCLMPVCTLQNQLKGALILFQTGKRFTYISGGTLREDTDFYVGHFLHYHMIQLSIERGYAFYDISVGGSKGVTRFKEGFGGVHVRFIDARHWVHNKTLFWMYSQLQPILRKNKKIISKLIKFLK